jgi:transaldolase
MSDPLAQLSAAGVAVWLDDLSRERLQTGNLAQLVRDRHVVGVTTNPTIFQKAITSGTAYDEQVRDLALRGVDIGEALRAITTADVRAACDLLRPVYEASGGVDGRVSIEVDPRIAHDTRRTVAEARALWWLVDRPNLFIKIPATTEGLPAISQALAEGISVNVTLIFGLSRYDSVMEAFLDGMERYRATGGDLSKVGSVASFFVSRVDTEIDKRLDKIGGDEAAALRGKAGVANARLAYQHYENVFCGERWKALEAAGAKPQRPLWASTGVKDPSYSDTMYVSELVAPGTVNTMPEPTMQAVHDHGVVEADSIRAHYAEAQEVMDRLGELGVFYDDVIDVLEREGVEKFDDSWNQLIEAVTEQLEKAGADVSESGSTSPAGSGPAAGSRSGSAK